MPAKRLENLLNPSADGGLGDVVRRAREMGELAAALGKSLPPRLSEGIVAANLRENGELVVICVSSAWASRLRFEADQLIAAARQTGADVQSCTIRVSTNQ